MIYTTFIFLKKISRFLLNIFLNLFLLKHLKLLFIFYFDDFLLKKIGGLFFVALC